MCTKPFSFSLLVIHNIVDSCQVTQSGGMAEMTAIMQGAMMMETISTAATKATKTAKGQAEDLTMGMKTESRAPLIREE